LQKARHESDLIQTFHELDPFIDKALKGTTVVDVQASDNEANGLFSLARRVKKIEKLDIRVKRLDHIWSHVSHAALRG